MPEFIYPLQINNNINLYYGDCLEVIPQLAREGIKVDMILADPPYGTTHCKWDAVIDFTRMWECIHSVSYDTTPVLLFSQQPFTSTLGCSNLKELRYNWVWEKTQATGFLNAKRMPMKCHEDIMVFYRKLPLYNPIKTEGHPLKIIAAKHKEKCGQGDVYNKQNRYTDYSSTERYPRSVLRYKTDKQTAYLYPTQKPVALLEYFIRTYTNEGDTVLDFVMGSGSTGVACGHTNRKFIGIEKEYSTFLIAKERMSK